MTRVLGVVGPTATGKSDLAVELALRLDGEIVNADSMQLYRGMDIGTAKLPEPERRGVPHHLLDVWPVQKSAAVAEYQSLARSAIDHLGLPVDEDDEQVPAGDLGIVADLGMPAREMGALLDDDLYPDEVLSEIAAQVGFGSTFDELAGPANA